MVTHLELRAFVDAKTSDSGKAVFVYASTKEGKDNKDQYRKSYKLDIVAFQRTNEQQQVINQRVLDELKNIKKGDNFVVVGRDEIEYSYIHRHAKEAAKVAETAEAKLLESFKTQGATDEQAQQQIYDMVKDGRLIEKQKLRFIVWEVYRQTVSFQANGYPGSFNGGGSAPAQLPDFLFNGGQQAGGLPAPSGAPVAFDQQPMQQVPTQQMQQPVQQPMQQQPVQQPAAAAVATQEAPSQNVAEPQVPDWLSG